MTASTLTFTKCYTTLITVSVSSAATSAGDSFSDNFFTAKKEWSLSLMASLLCFPFCSSRHQCVKSWTTVLHLFYILHVNALSFFI